MSNVEPGGPVDNSSPPKKPRVECDPTMELFQHFMDDMENEAEDTRVQIIIDKPNLLKLIECPICKEIPFPPIHNCSNGHIVCKDCRPKLKTCGICRGNIGGRNYPVEGIVLGSTFTCLWKDLGCSEVMLGSDYPDHLKRCEFNPFSVLCNEQQGTPCNNAKISSRGYLDHLLNVHKCETGGSKDLPSYKFIQFDDEAERGKYINTDYFEHDGEAFIQKWQYQDGVFYTWFCMLNVSGAKLNTWAVNVKLCYQNSPTSFCSTLVLHDAMKNLSEVKAAGSFMCLFPSQIKEFGGTGNVVYDGRTWEYIWESHIVMRRRQK